MFLHQKLHLKYLILHYYNFIFFFVKFLFLKNKKIKTTSPKDYCVKPNCGTLAESGSELDFVEIIGISSFIVCFF